MRSQIQPSGRIIPGAIIGHQPHYSQWGGTFISINKMLLLHFSFTLNDANRLQMSPKTRNGYPLKADPEQISYVFLVFLVRAL